jgi:hypothetical protein
MKGLRYYAFAIALLAAICMLAKPAKAVVVTAVICNNADFFCNQPGDVVVDSGIRSNGVGVLGANRYTILPFVFNDFRMNFTGTIVAADSGGRFIYSWGTGVATDFAPFGTGLFLDVTISQNYITVPGPAAFSELNVGDCNAVARVNASTSLVQGAVNGGLLPVLGGVGDCAAAPFVLGAGPFGTNIGLVTNMTAAAQFFFAPGAAGNQQITLPWGADFPDPIINFNDPNNPQNFITDTDIPAGFIDQNPEPGTFAMFIGALSAAALRLRRRSK